MNPEPDGASQSWAWLALDWLDLLIILACGYGAVGALLVLDVRVPSWVLGVLLGPIVFGALALRRRLTSGSARRSQRMVKKRLTLLGVLATALLVGGVVVAGFGGAILLDTSRAVPEPVSEVEVELLAGGRGMSEQLGALSVEEVDPGELRDAGVYAGGLAELMEAMEADRQATTDKHREIVRAELLTQRLREAAEAKSRRYGSALSAGVYGVLSILLGGFVDSRRARR